MQSIAPEDAMGNYVAAASQIRNFKVRGCHANLDDYSDSEIEDEITLAEEMVERLTGDVFYAKKEAHRFDGNGLPKMFFYPTVSYPLIDIESVKDFDIDGTTLLFTYVENRDYVRYDYYLETARSFAGDSPRRRFGDGGIWPKGQKNIEIKGTWGRCPTPAAIVRATLLLTLARLDPDFSELTAIGYESAQWEDFTIRFRGGEVQGLTTGIREVDNLLQPYINFVDMFLVIPDEKQTYDKKF